MFFHIYGYQYCCCCIVLCILLFMPVCLGDGLPPAVSSSPPQSCRRFDRGAYECSSVADFKELKSTVQHLLLRNCDGLESVNSSKIHSLSLACPSLRSLPSALAENMRSLSSISLPVCEMQRLSWQSLPLYLHSLNVSVCPISCNCSNYWLLHYNDTVIQTPPALSKCDFSICTLPSLTADSYVYDVQLGEQLNITIHVNGDILPSEHYKDKQYFLWAYTEDGHPYREVISDRRITLLVDKADERTLGYVGVKCWHCANKIIITIKIRVPVKLTAKFESQDELDSIYLTVRGYPIDNLTLTLTKIENGKALQGQGESHVLPKKGDVLFIRRIYVRAQEAYHDDIFYLRKYSLFTSEAKDKNSFGNYSFEVCSIAGCATLYAYVNFVNGFTMNGTTAELGKSTIDFPTPFGYSKPLSHAHPHSDAHSQPPQPPSSNSSSRLLYFLPVLVVLFLLSAVLIHKFYWTSLKKKYISVLLGRPPIFISQRRTESDNGKNREETVTLQLDDIPTPASNSEDYVNKIIPIIDLGEIKLFELLGKGIAGHVYRGELKGEMKKDVAVKVIKDATDELKREARLLSKLDHPNIVKLYGITADRDDLLLVLEIMRMGDLRNYVRSRKPACTNYAQFPPPLNIRELKFICYEIVKAVAYLGQNGVLHRDIAARNILVDGDSDNTFCSNQKRPPIRVKLSDFGMSRTLYGRDYYRMPMKGNIPIRWLPPEALTTNEYTHASDIWALGVTMWEVFTYGATPYENIPINNIAMFLQQGLKPNDDPQFAPGVYAFLCQCWAFEPKDRASSQLLMQHPFFDGSRFDDEREDESENADSGDEHAEEEKDELDELDDLKRDIRIDMEARENVNKNENENEKLLKEKGKRDETRVGVKAVLDARTIET